MVHGGAQLDNVKRYGRAPGLFLRASVNSHPPALQLSCSAYIAVAPLDLPTLTLKQTDRTPRHALA
jgi:hypothetical protein